MKKNIRNEYKITIKRNEFITQFECYLRNKKIRASKFADAYLRFLIYKEGDVCLFSPQPHQFYPFCFDKKINNKIKITISDEALNKDLIQYLTHNKCTVSDIFNALFYRMFCQNESQKLYQYLNLCFDSKSIHQINLEDGKPKNIIEINDRAQLFNIEIPLLNANLEKIIKEMHTGESVEQQKISQNKKIKLNDYEKEIKKAILSKKIKLTIKDKSLKTPLLQMIKDRLMNALYEHSFIVALVRHISIKTIAVEMSLDENGTPKKARIKVSLNARVLIANIGSQMPSEYTIDDSINGSSELYPFNLTYPENLSNLKLNHVDFSFLQIIESKQNEIPDKTGILHRMDRLQNVFECNENESVYIRIKNKPKPLSSYKKTKNWFQRFPQNKGAQGLVYHLFSFNFNRALDEYKNETTN